MSTATATRCQPDYLVDPLPAERETHTENQRSRNRMKSHRTPQAFEEPRPRNLGRSSVAIKREDEGVFETTGTVIAITDGVFKVRTCEETFRASRAVRGCFR